MVADDLSHRQLNVFVELEGNVYQRNHVLGLGILHIWYSQSVKRKEGKATSLNIVVVR